MIDIKGLFAGCSSLKKLPDISKWDLSNVKNIKIININKKKRKNYI